MRYLGIDTGGTFTDLVEIDASGKITIDKAFSTPSEPEQAVFDVLQQRSDALGDSLETLLASTGRLVHGTTVSTNALIQRRGAVVGLLTTAGFEDTLEIGRGPVGRTGGIPLSRALDFLNTTTPDPLVPKHLVRGINERVTARGEVIAPPDRDQIAQAISELIEDGAESLAVCFIWSFLEPSHEEMVRDAAAQVAPGIPVNLSSEIAPRLGEFERMVTTVVNAFIGPVSGQYINSMQDWLGARGMSHRLQVMKSSGGVTLPERVANEAVSVINSGPIGGLIAARHLGGLLGHKDIITADVGGTSFDVGIISDGTYEEQRTPFIDQGLPVHVPAIKLVTIGAGGGSIAWTDGFRLLVGPQSAGSVPGPASYGAGGTEPTVTDALVALGIIDPTNFFGGRRELDKEAALAAIEKAVAVPLGLDVMEAAAGIYEVVTARMGDLIRKATVESGNDPKDFCLMSYGGAGGAHCAAYSRQLGIRKVIIPYAAPVFSALGCALADIQCSHSKSEPVRVSDAPGTFDGLNNTLEILRQRVIADMSATGLAEEDIVFNIKLDTRYVGQMNEVALEWPNRPMKSADAALLRSLFDEHYESKYGSGTTHAASALEIISVRVEGIFPTDKPDLAPLFPEDSCGAGGDEQPKKTRKVYVRGEGFVDAEIRAFEDLRPGARLEGPAVVERSNTTVWLPPGSAAELDRYGNLEIQPAGGAG